MKNIDFFFIEQLDILLFYATFPKPKQGEYYDLRYCIIRSKSRMPQ